MTLTEGVLRLIHGTIAAPDDEVLTASSLAPELDFDEAAEPAYALEPAEEADWEPDSMAGEPGFADLEAGVAMVASGVAARVSLCGFPTWPGLLWRAYQLAEEAGVLILPTVVRQGGRVDIVITKENSADE